MVVVVMTVMTGLVRDFKTKNHDWVGDCVVSSDSLVGFAYYEEFLEALKSEDMVEAASPAVNSYALLTYGGSDWNESIEIIGIDPLMHCRATGFGRTLHYRKDDVSRVFEPMYDVNLPGCVVGIDKVLSRNKYGQYQQHQTVPGYSYTINCFPLTARGALVKTGLGLSKQVWAWLIARPFTIATILIVGWRRSMVPSYIYLLRMRSCFAVWAALKNGSAPSI
jgi:hypothetical protein